MRKSYWYEIPASYLFNWFFLRWGCIADILLHHSKNLYRLSKFERKKRCEVESEEALNSLLLSTAILRWIDAKLETPSEVNFTFEILLLQCGTDLVDS